MQISFPLIIGSVLLSGAAAAAAPAHPPVSVADLEARRAAAFERADTDGNGLVSAAELDRATAQHRRHPGGPPRGPGRPADPAAAAALDAEVFDALDANGDDVLSREEFSSDALRAAHASSRREARFARLDTNGDGQLSLEEFPPVHLASRDTNGDGMISEDEWPRRGPGPQGGPMDGPMHGGPGRPGPADGAH
jgi:Ca2+-binding EF-hand superfamily protein